MDSCRNVFHQQVKSEIQFFCRCGAARDSGTHLNCVYAVRPHHMFFPVKFTKTRKPTKYTGLQPKKKRTPNEWVNQAKTELSKHLD